jgi:type II secretory pathway pseudopilin PulG
MGAWWQCVVRFAYMEHSAHTQRARGTSMIELVVAIGIMSMIFLSLFAVFRSMTAFSVRNELNSMARLLAEEHIEMIRALPYDSVGTVGGIPSGMLPQTETIAHDGFTFTRRTFIQYVDDATDGTDTNDTLAADYKRVRVDVSYTYNNLAYHVPIIATIAPRSQESLEHAGVLRMVVVDAANTPVPSATVWVENSSIATTVDVTTFTNTGGIVSFPGAWEGTGYNISIEKAGYSRAGTYPVSVANPNPSPSPATVLENATTELYFRIDRLSTLLLETVASPAYTEHLDTFADMSMLSDVASTTANGNALSLIDTLGIYEPSGSARSTPFTPANIDTWRFFLASTTMPTNTDVRFRLWYDNGGTMALLPESALVGNATGFASTSVDLSPLATSTYHTLAVEALLTTTDPAATPHIKEWRIGAVQQPTPVATNITLTGTKTIGADASLAPIPKYQHTHTTDAAGTWATTTMEWDAYTATAAGYVVTHGCPALPIALDPDTSLHQTLFLAPASTHALSVTMQDTFGMPLLNGAVTVLETGETHPSNACGVTHFTLPSAGTYTVIGMHGGYAATTTPADVDGAASLSLTLSSL